MKWHKKVVLSVLLVTEALMWQMVILPHVNRTKAPPRWVSRLWLRINNKIAQIGQEER